MSRPRLGITTTLDRAPALGQVAIAHRLRPIYLPCIEVTPEPAHVLEQASQLASRADWILVTSYRTVPAIWPDRDMPSVPVAAVGTSTADAVRAAGGSVAVTGHTGARELIASMAADLDSREVFLPHGDRADPAMVEAVESAGARVSALTVYRTEPVPPASDPVDGVVFGSPSAVEGWTRSRPLDEVAVGAIGETTSAALTAHGRVPDVIPPSPDFEDLIELMALHLTREER